METAGRGGAAVRRLRDRPQAGRTLDGSAGYREFGAGAYDLRYDEQDLRSVTGALGFRGAYRRPVRFGLLSTTLRGELQHEFAGERMQGVDYADVGGPAFYTIASQRWSREQFMLSPGIVLSLLSGWDLGLSADLRAAAGNAQQRAG